MAPTTSPPSTSPRSSSMEDAVRGGTPAATGFSVLGMRTSPRGLEPVETLCTWAAPRRPVVPPEPWWRATCSVAMQTHTRVLCGDCGAPRPSRCGAGRDRWHRRRRRTTRGIALAWAQRKSLTHAPLAPCPNGNTHQRADTRTMQTYCGGHASAVCEKGIPPSTFDAQVPRARPRGSLACSKAHSPAKSSACRHDVAATAAQAVIPTSSDFGGVTSSDARLTRAASFCLLRGAQLGPSFCWAGCRRAAPRGCACAHYTPPQLARLVGLWSGTALSVVTASRGSLFFLHNHNRYQYGGAPGRFLYILRTKRGGPPDTERFCTVSGAAGCSHRRCSSIYGRP